MSLKSPMHPGEFVKELYMVPFGISSERMANALSVSPSAFSRFINGKSDLSIDMAFRLSIVIGRSVESWMNMQTNFDMQKYRESEQAKLASLRPLVF